MAAAGVGLEWPEATAAPCSQGRMEAGQSGSAGLMEAHTWAWLLDGQGCAVHTPTPEPGPLGEKGPRPERRGAGAGSGVGQHLLDDFAVCCRNVATCIMDVASHYIVGEVRLQNDVLWVHMHLRKEGNRWKRI